MILNSESLFNGYGIVQRSIMREPNLTLEVKGLYTYLCSFSGNGEYTLPNIEEIYKELRISENKYYKYRIVLYGFTSLCNEFLGLNRYKTILEL